MKPGELRRWRFPDDMPAAFNGAAIFMIIDIRGDRADFLIDGRHVRAWSRNWVYEHSEPLNETR
jgi:hypothetical protein